ncbi:MAG: hypothetical protein K5886_09380 [Lachnospiraceae bacterium]|nr:hypothetical protein [Lachnospiraceae bacterium]
MKKKIAVLTSVVLTVSTVLMGCTASDVAEVASAVEEIAEQEMAAEEAQNADDQEKSMPEESAEAETDDGAAGYYKLVKMVEDGEESSMMAELAQVGVNMYMVLSEDGTGCYDFMGDQTKLAWDDKKIWDPEDDETEPSEYTYKDGQLSVTGDNGDGMDFVKLTDEEKDYYLENGSDVDIEKLLEENESLEWLFGDAQEEDNPIGYYKMTEYMENGEESEDLKMLMENGVYMYLVLNEDGTGCMDMLGDADEFTWNDKELKFEDTDPSEYTYEDDVITVTEDEKTWMKFERLSEEEEKYYIENGSDVDLEKLAG